MSARAFRPALLVILLAASGCSSTQGYVRSYREHACPELIERHGRVAATPDYKHVAEDLRESYETRVARCHLDAHQPDEAISLARGWSDGLARTEVIARGAAMKGDDAQAREAIEALSAMRSASPRFFLEAPEPHRYAGEEWYLRAALRTWGRTKSVPLDSFVQQTLRAHREDLLSLAVASADLTAHTGAWAIWTGLVREARIEHGPGGDKTLLVAEGVDVRSELVEVDQRLKEIEVRQGMFDSRAQVDTRYDTTRTYEETFSPNGRKFVVRVPRVDERIVEARAIVAIGRYAKPDGSSELPVLDAVYATERVERQTKERLREK